MYSFAPIIPLITNKPNTCCHGSRLPRSWGTRQGLHPPWFPWFTTVHLKEIPMMGTYIYIRWVH